MARPTQTTLFRPFQVYGNPTFTLPPPIPQVAQHVWVYHNGGGAGQARLMSIDVRTPAAPSLMANNILTSGIDATTTNANPSIMPKNMFVTPDGFLVYVINNALMVRTDNPTNPEFVQQYANPTSKGLLWKAPILYKDNFLIIQCNNDGGGYFGGCGVAVVDISIRNTFQFKGDVATGGNSWNTGTQGPSTAVGSTASFGGDSVFWGAGANFSDDYIRYSGFSASLIGVADPTAFTTQGSFVLTRRNSYNHYAIYGQYLYIVNPFFNTIDAWNISGASASWYANGYANIADSGTNPTSHFLSIYQPATGPAYLFDIKTGSGPSAPDVRIYSMLDPTFVTLPSHNPTATITIVSPNHPGTDSGGNGTYGVCFSDHYMYYILTYVPSGDMVFYVYDIADPINPVLVNAPGTVMLTSGTNYPFNMGCVYPSATLARNFVAS